LEVQPISSVALKHNGTQDPQDGLNVWEVGLDIGIECHLVVITGSSRLTVIFTYALIKTIGPILFKNERHENGPIASNIGK